MNAELWITGGISMLVGMGIVFVFLIVLVCAILIMTKCIAFIDKICPPPVEETKTKAKAKKSDDTEIAIAIAVASAQNA